MGFPFGTSSGISPGQSAPYADRNNIRRICRWRKAGAWRAGGGRVRERRML